MEVNRQRHHVNHSNNFHPPEPHDVPSTAIAHLGINVIQPFAYCYLKILLEDFGQCHKREEEGGVEMLVPIDPRGGMARMHSHEWEGGEYVWVRLLILILNLAIYTLRLLRILYPIQDIRIWMMAQHMLHLPSESAGPNHIHCPARTLIHKLRLRECTMISVVLDIDTNHGRKESHGERPHCSDDKVGVGIHLNQTEPESA
mmetsp:Transcript_7996/g.19716  ORF Transcript_7996/g.19716 Transcript_7996/m.19716 type:complete len:201 (-) Transcript_7996:558-1160(-)